MILEDRVSKLEREVRWWRRGGVVCLVAAALALLVGGCEANPWRQNYQAFNANSGVTFSRRDAVQVRQVTIEQLTQGTDAARAYLHSRGIAKEDATAADNRRTRELLMAACRIPGNPDAIEPLGYSGLQARYIVSPNDSDLIRVAQQVGSDIVTLTTVDLGVHDGFVAAPTFFSTAATANAQAWGSGGYGYAQASGNAYTWGVVPVPAKVQTWGNIATFWRRVSPDERAKLDAAYNRRAP